MNMIFGAWKEDEKGLHKTFVFNDFEHALAFSVEVGRLAQAADHHPDIDIRFSRVVLTLLTHDRHAVTEKDRLLGAQIDQITLVQIETRIKTLF